MKNTGCKYREWDWHDGGPDYKCIISVFGCVNSYDDYFYCGDVERKERELINIKFKELK